MASLHVDIVTPRGGRAVKDVVFLDVPALSGRMTVLPRHQSYACSLAAGQATLRESDGQETAWSIGPGTMHVDDNLVTILVRRATPAATPPK